MTVDLLTTISTNNNFFSFMLVLLIRPNLAMIDKWASFQFSHLFTICVSDTKYLIHAFKKANKHNLYLGAKITSNWVLFISTFFVKNPV